MEKLNVYRPGIAHFIIFRKEAKAGKAKAAEGPIQVAFEEQYAKESQVREEAEYVIVELHKAIRSKSGNGEGNDGVRQMGQVGIVGGGPGGGDPEGWMDLEGSKLLEVVNKLKADGEKTAQRTLKENSFLRFIGSYTLISCGSRKNYWLESRIDVKGFMSGGKARRLKEVSSTSRIKSLNWMLTGANQFRGNALGFTGTPTNLYGLGNISYRQMDKFKGVFLLDIPLESEGESEVSGDIQERYKTKMETVIRNLGKFLAYHAMLLNHNKMEYNEADREANIIRQEVLNIQERIFNLQKGVTEREGKKEELKDLNKMRTEEEELLTSASITFSTVTRLEQSIGTNLYTCFGLNKSLEEITDAMAPSRIEVPEGEFEQVSSMFDEFDRFNDSLTAAYDMLRENVNITQTTLRNSLEVLRTFIEHQRSKIDEKKSRTFSMILVIFACFGIADALSNVLAYYISDRSHTALAYTAGAFVFSMCFSLMIFGILYIWIIKKVL